MCSLWKRLIMSSLRWFLLPLLRSALHFRASITKPNLAFPENPITNAAWVTLRKTDFTKLMGGHNDRFNMLNVVTVWTYENRVWHMPVLAYSNIWPSNVTLYYFARSQILQKLVSKLSLDKKLECLWMENIVMVTVGVISKL